MKVDKESDIRDVMVTRVARSSAWARMSDRMKLLVCFLGIFFSYLVFGFVQEKITRGSYGEGDGKERFTFFLFLVFVQCIINALVAKIVVLSWSCKGDVPTPRHSTPQSMYLTCSLSYVGAMLASNSSLKYVSYPTQVLGKSCKPIPGLRHHIVLGSASTAFSSCFFPPSLPVMLLGVLFSRKRYPFWKYVVVLLIVSGVAIFLYKDRGHSQDKPTEGLGWGEVLLIVSLFLDGLTGVFQNNLKEYRTGSFHMMLYLNIWSIVVLLPVLVFSGQGVTSLSFLARHPEVLSHLLAFGMLSALGQIFIFQTIENFGPLTCSIITTTRKFFTILCSVVLFGNVLLARQWFGVFLVFLGLCIENFGKKERDNKS
eukprot:m.23188 g.23188  ORF g.23188 m.23188 type:complete len:370 (+) comp28445_c0_seq1:31-1140(+)